MASATTEAPRALDVDAAWAASGAADILGALDRELIGLAPVKARLSELAALLVVDRLRAELGVAAPPPTLHCAFTGSPGTGKTTVALRMGGLLKALGYVSRGHLVAVTRDDLVGQYVGHTAPRTLEAVRRAAGGVLFIDEAYTLHKPGNERDYGAEAIEVLLQAMEERRNDFVVVFAGYADRMTQFFASNPGLRSRVGLHVEFPDASPAELAAIAERLAAERGYGFSDDARTAFAEYLERRMRQPDFANARSVRNAVDRARLRHARRVIGAGGVVDAATLTTLDAVDVRASRVFAQPPPE